MIFVSNIYRWYGCYYIVMVTMICVCHCFFLTNIMPFNAGCVFLDNLITIVTMIYVVIITALVSIITIVVMTTVISAILTCALLWLQYWLLWRRRMTS